MSGQAQVKGVELSDVIHLRGCIELALYDQQGKMVEGTYRRIDNTVVTAGRRWVLSRIKSDSPATETITSVAVGTATTGPGTGETALGSQTTRIAIGTYTTTGLDINPPSWRAEALFATDQANTTLGEAGLFNSSSGGTMLSRVTYTTIDKKTSNTLSVSYTISN